LTIFLSLVFTAGFFASFLRNATRRRGKGLEQQSLMPLEPDDHSNES